MPAVRVPPSRGPDAKSITRAGRILENLAVLRLSRGRKLRIGSGYLEVNDRPESEEG